MNDRRSLRVAQTQPSIPSYAPRCTTVSPSTKHTKIVNLRPPSQPKTRQAPHVHSQAFPYVKPSYYQGSAFDSAQICVRASSHSQAAIRSRECTRCRRSSAVWYMVFCETPCMGSSSFETCERGKRALSRTGKARSATAHIAISTLHLHYTTPTPDMVIFVPEVNV